MVPRIIPHKTCCCQHGECMQGGFYDKRKIGDVEVEVEVEICHVIIATRLASVGIGTQANDCVFVDICLSSAKKHPHCRREINNL